MTLRAAALLLSAVAFARGDPTDRIVELEARLAALEGRAPCANNMPLMMAMSYSGCNRNTVRDTRRSVETCQNGTVTPFNVSAESGLFDIEIANGEDAWTFVCGFARERPHEATCTLTFETPARPEGPAWLLLRFTRVVATANGACVGAAASITGTYFYDGLTNDAGVYVFHANATSIAV